MSPKVGAEHPAVGAANFNELLDALKSAESTIEGRTALTGLTWSESVEPAF
ncbi:hypothetical protein ACWEO2_26300 [Nocardia sp. NPDC004278]